MNKIAKWVEAAATPTITTTGTPTAFTACAGTASAEQSFTVSGSNLTTNITVTAPTGFEVSTTSGSGFGSSATLTQSGGTVATTPVYVRMASLTASPTAANVTVSSTGATDKTVAVSGTVSVCVSCPSSNTLYVNASVSGGTGDGSTWANAYTSLSDALATAHACSNVTLIKVAAGTYKPTKKPFNAGVEMTTTTGSRDITFHIPDGVTIEGGYNASTGTRDIAANVTTLSGDIGIANDNSDNCYHVVLTSTASTNTTSTIKIDGFAITGGNANGTYYIVVNGNTVARNIGGGICTLSGTNTLKNNMIYSNSVSEAGGGIYAYNGTNTLTNNTIYSNSASFGGGIYTNSGTNTLTNNTIYSNSASDGGGILTNFGTNTLTNNIFWQNKLGADVSVAGADYYAVGANGNTFKNNLLQLASSNYTSTGSGNYDLGTAASGNLFAQDPLFVSTTAPINLALQATSPCINAGISGVGIPTTDITGATRTGNPDLGAYEYFAPALPFITRWDLSKTGSGATQISFGVGTTGTVNYTWTQVGGTGSGSGTFTGSTATITGLPSGSIIDLSISPTNFNRFIMSNGTDKARLTQIKQWGTMAWGNTMAHAFAGCSNMTLIATDVPNTAAVIDMSYMFYNCSTFNEPLHADFNTAAVISMFSMFSGCTAYNQALPTNLNTAAVTNMSGMFSGCSAYNQALPTNLNTAAVTNMQAMFSGCTAYNQVLPTNFNTAAVTNMNGMFYNCTAYNQALPANFNTTAVTNMQSMFSGCSAYNQALPANFNTAAVTNMQGMFASCRAYNQALPANFNTAAVTNMLGMFNGCTAYNQALPANFNTAAVTNMSSMFSGATAFNQSLAGLQLNANVNLANFLDNSGLSVANYDATLTAFKNSGITGRTMGALGLKYCAAEADKVILEKTIVNGGLGWTITDGGKSSSCVTGTLTLGMAINPTNCTGTPNGSIAFTSSGFAAGSQTLNYKKDNVAATPTTVSIAADGSFTLTGLGAGVYSDFAIGSTIAAGSKTLVLETTLPSFTLNNVNNGLIN